MSIQIDVLSIVDSTVTCVLQTGDRDVRIAMTEKSYNDLLADRFFIRDGKSRDSAGVLNHTETYYPQN